MVVTELHIDEVLLKEACQKYPGQTELDAAGKLAYEIHELLQRKWKTLNRGQRDYLVEKYHRLTDLRKELGKRLVNESQALIANNFSQ